MQCFMCDSEDVVYTEVIVDPCNGNLGYFVCQSCGLEWFDDTFDPSEFLEVKDS